MKKGQSHPASALSQKLLGGRPSFPAGAKALPGNHNKGALRSFRYCKTHLLPAFQLCGGCNGIRGFPYH